MTTRPEQEKKIELFFNDESTDYKRRHEDEGIPESMQTQIDAILDIKASSVLDVGSGPGSLLLELAKNGVQTMVGIDLSPEMTKLAQKRLEDEGFGENIRFISGSFLDVAIDDKLDAISLHRVLCCHPDLQGMLEKSSSYQPRIITLSVPRDWLIARGVVFLIGIFAKLFNSFRPYVYKQKEIDRRMNELGYQIKSRNKERWWVTTTYELVE